MEAINLEALGFTKEELQSKLVDRLCEEVLTGRYVDRDDDEEYTASSKFYCTLEQAVREQVDLIVIKVAEDHILPKVDKLVEGECLQPTNRWGEPKGEPMTFKEYLVDRAHKWFTEKVDSNGKTEKESNYQWRGAQTRLAYMVHEHLQYTISTAMKEALQSANSALADGINETVRTKLREVTNAIQVAVKVK